MQNTNFCIANTNFCLYCQLLIQETVFQYPTDFKNINTIFFYYFNFILHQNIPHMFPISNHIYIYFSAAKAYQESHSVRLSTFVLMFEKQHWKGNWIVISSLKNLFETFLCSFQCPKLIWTVSSNHTCLATQIAK